MRHKWIQLKKLVQYLEKIKIEELGVAGILGLEDFESQ